MSAADNLRDRLRVAIRDAWSTQPTCWDRQTDATLTVLKAEFERCTCGEPACESTLCDCDAIPCPVNHRAEEAEVERDALAAQVTAISTIITEDYGTDYDDEDVPAAVERLMQQLSAHETNVRRIAQSKNEALVRSQAENERLRAELNQRKLTAERDVCSGCMQREQQRDQWAEACRQNGIKAERYEQAWYREKGRAEQAEAGLAEAQKRADWLRSHAEWLSNERDALKAELAEHEKQVRTKVAEEILADVEPFFAARINPDIWEAAYRAARIVRGES